jgi:hypothetical protein
MIALLLILYCLAVALVALYGINYHVMIALFKRRITQHREEEQRLLKDFYHKYDLPVVPQKCRKNQENY